MEYVIVISSIVTLLVVAVLIELAAGYGNKPNNHKSIPIGSQWVWRHITTTGFFSIVDSSSEDVEFIHLQYTDSTRSKTTTTSRTTVMVKDEFLEKMTRIK